MFFSLLLAMNPALTRPWKLYLWALKEGRPQLDMTGGVGDRSGVNLPLLVSDRVGASFAGVLFVTSVLIATKLTLSDLNTLHPCPSYTIPTSCSSSSLASKLHVLHHH